MSARLEKILKAKDIPYQTEVSSALLCSFRIGGIAPILVDPRCLGELIEVLQACRRLSLPYYLLGKGSNLLFPDGRLSCILIRTLLLDAVAETKTGFVAQCGASLVRLSYLAARRGMRGLAFACGIPGSVGGAVYMNAGAYGRSLADVVKSVRCYLPDADDIRTYFNDELSYSYRNSRFQSKNEVVLSAELVLEPGADPREILQEMRKQNRARSAVQPLDLPSAGSSFRRLESGVALSRTIDELGLKGLRVGDAAVSQKHAGFIVNLGNASAADVRLLIEKIQKILLKERGILPQPELCFVPD